MNRQRSTLGASLAGAALLAALAACWNLLHHRAGARVVLGSAWWPIVLGSSSAAASTGWLLARELGGAAVRMRSRALAALIAATASWAACLVWVQPYQRLWATLAVGIAAGAWAALVLALESPRLRRIPNWVLRGLGALCLFAFGLELGLAAWARAAPSPLFSRAADGPRAMVERFRCRPGSVRFGFPCNSRGFYDVETTVARADFPRVAAVGDSFLLGSVPHYYNWTSVCERVLRAEVLNFGVAGCGPSEYLQLALDEALPSRPAALVVALFVGNDLTCADPEEGRHDAWARAWLERGNVWSWIVPQRMARRAAERRRQQDQARAPGAVPGEAMRQMDPNVVRAQMPWLEDPLLEPESMSPAAYASLELRRALDICRGRPAGLDLAIRELQSLRRACAETFFAVVLVPDEFQVEEVLWDSITAQVDAPLERDLPQRLLARWLGEQGIPFLDLLPVLRAQPALADGRLHLYHLRDTHFNARGNRAAGEALAEFLRPHLSR